MAWVNFEKYVLKMADFQQILGVNEQILQIFGKPNADFWAKKYGNTASCLHLHLRGKTIFSPKLLIKSEKQTLNDKLKTKNPGCQKQNEISNCSNLKN